MSDKRHNPHIRSANDSRERAASLQFSYDTERLKKENRYRVKGQAFPKNTNGFNWGACLLTPIWGYFNKTYLACFWIVLAIIPFIGIILSSIFSLYCGIKGNDWAWENNEWDNIEQMHYVQRKWGIAGLIVNIILAFLMFGGLVNQVNTLQRSGLI